MARKRWGLEMGISVILLLGIFSPAQGRVELCPDLNGPRKDLALEILATRFPYYCCDQTIEICLVDAPQCKGVPRLADHICQEAEEGLDRQALELALNQRSATLLDLDFGKPLPLSLTGVPMAGDPSSPITLVEFASARGPHCARATPLIHEAVVKGPLKGLVKLYLKPFPLRKNPHSKEAGLAFMAASRMGKAWEFLLLSYARFQEFTPEHQIEWAEEVGMDREAFEGLMAKPGLKKELVAHKREGLERGVTSTPAFFINGHRYRGTRVEDLVELLQALAEARP